MDDLEITRLCAEAMGVNVQADPVDGVLYVNGVMHPSQAYSPLTDDAQAMALVRHFALDIGSPFGDGLWHARAYIYEGTKAVIRSKADEGFLNRAICLCVAKMPRA